MLIETGLDKKVLLSSGPMCYSGVCTGVVVLLDRRICVRCTSPLTSVLGLIMVQVCWMSFKYCSFSTAWSLFRIYVLSSFMRSTFSDSSLMVGAWTSVSWALLKVLIHLGPWFHKGGMASLAAQVAIVSSGWRGKI